MAEGHAKVVFNRTGYLEFETLDISQHIDDSLGILHGDGKVIHIPAMYS